MNYDPEDIINELYSIRETLCTLDIEDHPYAIVAEGSTNIMRIIDRMISRLKVG